ncbi:MAG: glycosyltransferase [Rhodospirillaceae bacterium]|nr:glycosyltransferase [Rhodospirillaceae bacterium]
MADREMTAPSISPQPGTASLTARQIRIRDMFDLLAPARADWVARNSYFHAADRDYMRFIIPAGASVLEIGCGDGELLAALSPSRGVGVDLSQQMVAQARARHPTLEFHAINAEDADALGALTGPFDYIVVSDTVGLIEDCETLFRNLRALASPETRLVVAFYSRLWEPILRLAERLKLKMPQAEQNWLSTADIANLLTLSGYEVVRQDWRQLVPKRLLGLGTLINRFIATLPFIRHLCLRNYAVARLAPTGTPTTLPSVSVLIPCRNEKGNIENAVKRLPKFAPDLEILFVEGHSKDGTFEECERIRAAFPDRDIKVMRQDGKGKGDAVRKGFNAARGEILIILDADLTVAPEDIPKFYRALVEGRGEFINGTRLVYPMEDTAMRTLNNIANRGFALIFSYLLNQRFTDTLCGTKALRKRDYDKIVANRAYFGDFDPFGDFDLIFGAAKLNLRIVEIPIRYAGRSYGETQISRFTHGWLLLRMVMFAWRKLKAF